MVTRINLVGSNVDLHFLEENGVNDAMESLPSEDLPRELKLIILKYLPIKDLINAAQICKSWYSSAQDGTLRLVDLRQEKEQAQRDIIWLRQLPDICGRTFWFDKVPENPNPFVERQALLNELARPEFATASEQRNTQMGKLPLSFFRIRGGLSLLNEFAETKYKSGSDYDRGAAFAVAAEHGNIQMGRLLLPLIPKRDWDIPAAFAKCADRSQPDFARWLISTQPAEVNLTGETTIQVECDIGYGNALFLHGNKLCYFLTNNFYNFAKFGYNSRESRDFNGCGWDIGLPMSCKEEKTKDGKTKIFWETVLLWNQMRIWGGPHPWPTSPIPFKPVIHTNDGRWVWSKGDNFSMTVGTSTHICPKFE